MSNRPIGMFDSGVGGLTVALEVVKQLPNEEIIYFGDTERNPYGNKSNKVIIDYSNQIMRFLTEKNIKLAIIACNTSSIASIEQLRKNFSIPIIGVVEPGISAIIEATSNNKIGLLATESTVKSGMYEKCIKEKSPSAEIYKKACPLLVPLAEEFMFDNEITYLTAKYYIDDLITEGIDSIVLGCTHFSLHKNTIKKVVGDIKIIDPAQKTIEEVKETLINNNIINNSKEKIMHKFYVSGEKEKFSQILNYLFRDNFNVEKVDINKY